MRINKFYIYIALFIAGLGFFSLSYGADITFLDVASTNQYRDAIEYLHTQNILQGDSGKTTFRPADNLNRAEFAAIIIRSLDLNPTMDAFHDCFPDVKKEWFAPAVCKAKELGFVKGYGSGPLAGKYGPSEKLNNAEIIVVMSRMAGWDLEEGESWYEPAWNYAEGHGILANVNATSYTARGLMAEVIFRTAVVERENLDLFCPIKAAEFREMNSEISSAFTTVVETEETNTLNITSTPFPTLVVQPADKDVALFRIAGKMGIKNSSAQIKGIRFYLYDATQTENLARLYFKDDQTGKILFDRDLKLFTISSPFIIKFELPLVFNGENESGYTLYADFDYETKEPVQLYISSVQDFNTQTTVKASFPLMSRKIMRDPEFYDESEDPAKMEKCASWDGEYNLPFPSQNKSLDYANAKPAERSNSVTLEEGAHAVLPIDQGNRGICAAAAVYSSLRWLEDTLGKDFIRNGTEGLEALVKAFYDGITTSDEQNEAIEVFLENLNACITVEYDTQAGSNVACEELIAYKEKKCDIPIAFYCDKIDPATGNPAEGAGAENWVHRVDLVDVAIDPYDDDQCTITFANSWKDSKNPDKDLDGLGAGRYERALYNDDDESFDIESPWSDKYKCKLRAATYICVEEGEC